MSNEWMPIETAPKDGTRVLLFRQGYDESICSGWWSALYDEWLPALGVGTARGATHWMPLPEPPK